MENLSEQAKYSKNKILKASEELFAQKGFDGTSVNEIAKQAEVNKALIYYYFKSKGDILQQLFSTFVYDIVEEVIYKVKKEAETVATNEFFDSEFIDIMVNRYIDFFLERRNIIRVMMAESLKKGTNSTILFKFTDYLNSEQVKSVVGILKEKGIKVEIDNNITIGKFFMGLIPIINFAIYFDDWKEHYRMKDDEVKGGFVSIYKMYYEGYKTSFSEN